MFEGAINCHVPINEIIERLIEPGERTQNTIILYDYKGWTTPNNMYALYKSSESGEIGNKISNDVTRQPDGTFLFTINTDIFPSNKVWVALINITHPNSVYNSSVYIPPYEGTYTVNKPFTLTLNRSFFDGIGIYALKHNGNFITQQIRSGNGKFIAPRITFNKTGTFKIDIVKITFNRLFTTEVVNSFYLTIESDPMICFKEGTKILTSTGYVPIERLRKGQFVKTLNNNFIPVAFIGKKSIYHPASSERIADQLYKCNRSNYPTVFEDLVLTGRHALLVNQLTSDEKEQTIKLLGENYMTDNKYKLPSCVDKKSTVYEKQGNYTIYHVALENVNPYGNYGIYANGLLVESCSTNALQSESGMEVITNKLPLLIV